MPPDDTAALLTGLLGMKQAGERGGRASFAMAGADPGATVEIVADRRKGGLHAGGTVHHIAFRAPDRATQETWRDHLATIVKLAEVRRSGLTPPSVDAWGATVGREIRMLLDADRPARALGLAEQALRHAPTPGAEAEVRLGAALVGSRFRFADATNRQAAHQLDISAHTVSTHLRHVFTKLGITSRVELTRMALAHLADGA